MLKDDPRSVDEWEKEGKEDAPGMASSGPPIAG